MGVFAWLPLLAADIGVNQNSGRSFAVPKNQGTHRDSEVGTRERRCDIEDRKRQFALGALHIERWGGEHDHPFRITDNQIEYMGRIRAGEQPKRT